MSKLDWFVKLPSAIAALVAVILIPIKVVSWADDNFQSKEEAMLSQARSDILHDRIRAAAALEAWELRLELAESELIDLELLVQEGATLTPTQQRRMRSLENNIELYKGEIAEEKAVLTGED